MLLSPIACESFGTMTTRSPTALSTSWSRRGEHKEVATEGRAPRPYHQAQEYSAAQLGTVTASDEKSAIEKAAAEFQVKPALRHRPKCRSTLQERRKSGHRRMSQTCHNRS